ncbi:hypothetical protein GCM10020229_54180 [Kitasatospora albolonga]
MALGAAAAGSAPSEATAARAAAAHLRAAPCRGVMRISLAARRLTHDQTGLRRGAFHSIGPRGFGPARPAQRAARTSARAIRAGTVCTKTIFRLDVTAP